MCVLYNLYTCKYDHIIATTIVYGRARARRLHLTARTRHINIGTYLY